MPLLSEHQKRDERSRTLYQGNKAILDKAERESRELTAEEASTFDKNMREAEAIHHRGGGAYLTRREAIEDYGTWSLGPIAGGRQTADSEDVQLEGWRTAAGATTRALEPRESVNQAVRARGQFDEELRDVRAGDVLRALATGPRNDAERRALSMGLDTAGGYMVPSILSGQIIDLMRARSVCIKAGARTLPLEGGEMNIAKVVTDPTPAWRGENTAVSEQEVVFGSLTLRPKVLAMVVKSSRELLETAPNAGALLEQTFARVMALKIDEAALIGASGEAEAWITGVSGTDGIHLVDHGSASATWDLVLEMRQELMCANSDEPTGLILNPRDESTLARLRDGEGLPYPRPDAVENLKVLPTTSIPVVSTETIALLGDFTRLLICPKVNLRIQILNERYADYLQVGFLCWLMTDVAVEEPASFCKATAIKAL